MNDDDNEFIENTTSQAENLVDRMERPEFSRPAAVVGIVCTAVIWFVVVMFPEFMRPFLSMMQMGKAIILVITILFVFPSVAALGLGHILFPSLDDDAPVTGFGSGYQQSDKSEKRWKLIIVAAMFGVLNVILTMFLYG